MRCIEFRKTQIRSFATLRTEKMNEKILSFIANFNHSWTKGKLDLIPEFLHEKVVFISPDLSTEIVGIEACIKTFEDYLNTAKTNKFRTTDIGINIWNSTAMVVLEYYVEYEIEEQVYKENCTECWTLVNQSEKWKLAWRALVKNELFE